MAAIYWQPRFNKCIQFKRGTTNCLRLLSSSLHLRKGPRRKSLPPVPWSVRSSFQLIRCGLQCSATDAFWVRISTTWKWSFSVYVSSSRLCRYSLLLIFQCASGCVGKTALIFRVRPLPVPLISRIVYQWRFRTWLWPCNRRFVWLRLFGINLFVSYRKQIYLGNNRTVVVDLLNTAAQEGIEIEKVG